MKLRPALSLLAVLSAAVIMTVNGYAGSVQEKVTARIKVNCVGKNTDEKFVYSLKQETEDFQQVENKTLALKNGESGEFEIAYEVPGTYEYEISQEKGSDKDTTYDSTVYNVTVYVLEDDSGKMSTEIVAFTKGSEEKKAEIKFTNSKKKETKKTGTSGSSKSGSSGSGDSKTASKPKTADDRYLGMYIRGILASGIGLAVLFIGGLMKKKEEQ